ncbi:nucleoside/nucleotide kinase family protein, partial [Streptomyces sp. ZEA17I]
MDFLDLTGAAALTPATDRARRLAGTGARRVLGIVGP